MVQDIKVNCEYKNKEELRKYLIRILDREAFDRQGLIYGVGHAIYTISDPRATP